MTALRRRHCFETRSCRRSRAEESSQFLQLRAGREAMFCRYTGTQFEHATRARREPHAANSHVRTYAQHPALAIHEHHVDGVPHPEGMDARARRDEQTFGEIERLSDEET